MADVSDRSVFNIKNPLLEMKGMQENKSILCVGKIEISVPQDHSLALLGKPRDARP